LLGDTSEVNRNVHHDFFGEVDLYEVDVADIAAHWVTLHFFHNCVV